MRSHSLSPEVGDHPRHPEQTQPAHAAAYANSTHSRSFMNGPGLFRYQAAPLYYPVSMFQDDGYAQTAFVGQAFASSVMPVASYVGGYGIPRFSGTPIWCNYLQLPPMYICLRGGADSPADVNPERPVTNVNAAASGSDDDDDSLYRSDFTPRDLGEFSEALRSRTHSNGTAFETLDPEHPYGVPVHRPQTPLDGLYAPVDGPYTPVDEPYTPIDGFYPPVNSPSAPVDNPYARVNGIRAPANGIHAPADGFHAPINSHTRVPYPGGFYIQNDLDIPSINRRIPYPGRSSIQRGTRNPNGAHVDGNPPASRPRRSHTANSTSSRIYGMTDAQQEEEIRILDWWYCELLGHAPLGASYSSNIDPRIAANNLGPNGHPDWSQGYNYTVEMPNYRYNPTAGFEMQQQNVGYNLFPQQQNGTFPQVPVQQQVPSSNMLPTHPGAPERYHRNTAPEVPSMIPTHPDVYMSGAGPATAQPANTNTQGERRSGFLSREILDRLRETRDNARSRMSRRGRNGSRRD